ncbi:unnamed protein product [Blepharisma stoltei]|uniref:Uncharacterized protein n=1 Tax=Blepharisma stoltei TaxID=1481888 RepID=A0AAU9IU98_9CILI|nr:unnamed protein product [Blepharisma stoltei]
MQIAESISKFHRNVPELAIRRKTVVDNKEKSHQIERSDFADIIKAQNINSIPKSFTDDLNTLAVHVPGLKHQRQSSVTDLKRSYTERTLLNDEPDSANELSSKLKNRGSISSSLHYQFLDKISIEEWRIIHSEIYEIAENTRIGLLEKVSGLGISKLSPEDIKEIRQLGKNSCLLCGCSCRANNKNLPRNLSQLKPEQANSFPQTNISTFDLSETASFKRCKKCLCLTNVSDSSSYCEYCLISPVNEAMLNDQIAIIMQIKSNLEMPIRSQKSSRNHDPPPISSNMFENGRLKSITPPKRRLPSISGCSSKEMQQETSPFAIDFSIGGNKLSLDLSLKSQYLRVIIPQFINQKETNEGKRQNNPEALMQTSFTQLAPPFSIKNPITPCFKDPNEGSNNDATSADMSRIIKIIGKLKATCAHLQSKSISLLKQIIADGSDYKSLYLDYLVCMSSILKGIYKVFPQHAQPLEAMMKCVSLLFEIMMQKIESLTQESLSFKVKAISLQAEIQKKEEEHEAQYSQMNNILQKYEGIIDYYKNCEAKSLNV